MVAQEIELALEEGEALGIIGPNGAGKTTLLVETESHSARKAPITSSSPQKK